jgi:hypothetical protein
VARIEGALALERLRPPSVRHPLETGVADIFQEVDEEVRRERLKQLWERHSNLIVAVAVLIVVAVGGWRGYQWWETKKAAEAGAVFESAAKLAAEGKQLEAEEAFARIAAEGAGGYRTLARLRHAAQLATRDRDAAVKEYDDIAAARETPTGLADVARIKAAMLLVDRAPLDEMRRRLEPLIAGGQAFRHTARELLAFTAWRLGDLAAAKQWLQAIVADPETPQGTRSRTEMLLALAAPEAKS